MKIVWDENKRLTNLAKHHGMDFADLGPDFFDRAVKRPSPRGRFLAIGLFEDVVVVAVVYRPLGAEAVSDISMRPSSRKERKLT